MITLRSKRNRSAPDLPTLEAIEIHSGMIFGPRRGPLEETRGHAHESFEVALDRTLVGALQRPPCLVAFSGGRDSSAILAAATDVARREGLADPIPVTLRYSDHPRTWEDEWQQELVRHLDLIDWEIIQISDEMDGLGTIAREALLENGLYWPPNAHSMMPLLRPARGGTLLTGNGGDELFSSLTVRRKLSVKKAVHALPPRRLAVFLVMQGLPKRLRDRLRFRRALSFPWLQPPVRRELRNVFLRTQLVSLDDPIKPVAAVERLNTARYLELARATLGSFAKQVGTNLCEPFLEPPVMRAAARSAGDGFTGRAQGLQVLFCGVLPKRFRERTTKAVFTEVFWGPETRRFATEWDGRGLDDSLVDTDALRREWSKDRPDLRSMTPLQAAWLRARPPTYHPKLIPDTD